MIIVADANIVDVTDTYRQHGELRLLNGREICTRDVADADALLVRSITRVNAELLKDSPLRFVATATSGTDHLDLAYLRSRGIQVCDAAGSNANAVAEYVLCVLAQLSVRNAALDLGKGPVGIVGFGHVGQALYRKLSALGISCCLCDPFMENDFPQLAFTKLEEVMACPVVSLHTPLTREGSHPTFHMLNAAMLSRLPRNAVLINAARGELLATDVLSSFLRERRDVHVVLDCWEGEPQIDISLLNLVSLGTPHIAGYSQQAKRAASQSNYRDFLEFFHLQDARQQTHGGSSDLCRDMVATTETDPWRLLMQILQQVFYVADIDARLRGSGEGANAALFDRIRRELGSRQEFSAYTLVLDHWTEQQRSPQLLTWLHALGFAVTPGHTEKGC